MILIRGGRVVDPSLGLDGTADVLLRGGHVAAVGAVGAPAGAEIIDAAGLVVVPGLIDVHVHLREPGMKAKETLDTGTAAAAAGGFTTVFCMPNTKPALDAVEPVRWLLFEIERRALVRVQPIAAISRSRGGHEAVNFDALAGLGVAGFSDDGDTTADSAVMRQALEASRRLHLPVMVHCEDKALAAGAMHDGEVSRRLGITGIPAEAEEIVIARDLLLADLTGGWLHVCHVTTGRGAEMIRRAKLNGVRVTAEVMPHHLTMTDEWVAGSRRLVNVDEPAGAPAGPADPNTKVNPPLRPEADATALLAALKDGDFDLVSTDHAPHADPEKAGTSFERAAFGFTASELALPTMLALVRAGHLSLSDLVLRLANVPARLWRLPTGTLAPGAPADVVVFDPEERWIVSRETLKSKSLNTPLLGMKMRGRVKLTLVGGEERHRA
jgi:dihydroorotase